MDVFTQRRNRLVDEYIARSVRDTRVVDAMRAVPRHLFVPENRWVDAYLDEALSIGYGQTISQPSLVAVMTEALELDKGNIVLEIGTGSGYQAAVLSLLARQVITVEHIDELAHEARERLHRLGYNNVQVVTGDGKRGHAESAPYDAILVTAGAIEMPPMLLTQLKEGGRIVIPLGKSIHELTLQVGRKSKGGLTWQTKGQVAFVPLI